MNHFSIKDIERLSGIKAHTLRIWEQRHGMCFCKRKQSQHRYYDNEDLKQILRIAYLYHNGYKVSKIAKLTSEEIKGLANRKAGELNYDILINQLVEASVDYDQLQFESILNSIFHELGFEKCIRYVLYPFFEKIGLLWMTEHVLPAHEHFSSYLIQKKIIVAIDELQHQFSCNHNVLIFAPKGEHHEIPLLVMQYLFKKHGIRTTYFGANISISDVEYYCNNKTISHVFLHLITNFLSQEPRDYMDGLKNKFPTQKLIFSGPAFHEIPDEANAFTILRGCRDMFQLPGVLLIG